jgi:hypothetical protein
MQQNQSPIKDMKLSEYPGSLTMREDTEIENIREERAEAKIWTKENVKKTRGENIN